MFTLGSRALQLATILKLAITHFVQCNNFIKFGHNELFNTYQTGKQGKQKKRNISPQYHLVTSDG